MKHSRLTHRLLHDDEVIELWYEFGKTIGLHILHDIYGDYWPRRPVQGELVYAWYDKVLIGWTAIRPDPVDPVMWIIAGVLPQYQDKGYVTDIFNKTVQKGFNIFPDVQWAFVAISNKNPQFIEHHERLVKETCRWERAGEMNIPQPGYVIYGRKRNVGKILR